MPVRHKNTWKRVTVWLPFFCAWLLSSPAFSACTSSYFNEQAKVAYVHDGDTFKLTDGRKVRIIGINTPEMARDNQPAEPYALQAKQALQVLVNKSEYIQLRYGIEKHDRYGRLLAHVFLADGENVTENLLKQGLGMALTIPPNLWQLACYQQAEKSAYSLADSIWQHPRYQPIEANAVNDTHKGYYRVRGTIQHIGESRSAYWLNLSSHMVIKINKTDLAHFTKYKIQSLKGKSVIARGWIFPGTYKNRRQYRLTVRHPSSLVIRQ